MTKTIKLFISLFLFYFLSANRSYAQNAYVLLKPPEYSKVKFYLYSQDSVLIDSFFAVNDTTFVLKLPINHAYYLKIMLPNHATNYYNIDEIIPLDFKHLKPYTIQKYTMNSPYFECWTSAFNPINFKTNEATIPLFGRQTESLDMLIHFLQLFPFMKIEIMGHTDHLEKNKQNLSLKRAEVVKDYLMTHKISKSIIKIEGKGATEPTVPNIVDGKKDKNNMALNRRVDFKTYNHFGLEEKAIVLVFADSIIAQETQVTGDLYYPSGDSIAISEKCIYSYENIKILYLFSAFDYILEVKRNNNVIRLPIDLSKKNGEYSCCGVLDFDYDI
jgi:hypothetical protein